MNNLFNKKKLIKYVNSKVFWHKKCQGHFMVLMAYGQLLLIEI